MAEISLSGIVFPVRLDDDQLERILAAMRQQPDPLYLRPSVQLSSDSPVTFAFSGFYGIEKYNRIRIRWAETLAGPFTSEHELSLAFNPLQFDMVWMDPLNGSEGRAYQFAYRQNEDDSIVSGITTYLAPTPPDLPPTLLTLVSTDPSTSTITFQMPDDITPYTAAQIQTIYSGGPFGLGNVDLSPYSAGSMFEWSDQSHGQFGTLYHVRLIDNTGHQSPVELLVDMATSPPPPPPSNYQAILISQNPTTRTFTIQLPADVGIYTSLRIDAGSVNHFFSDQASLGLSGNSLFTWTDVSDDGNGNPYAGYIYTVALTQPNGVAAPNVLTIDNTPEPGNIVVQVPSDGPSTFDINGSN